MSNDRYEPAEEFVKGLEWQVRREARGRERFPAPPRYAGGRRGMRAAALILVSLLAGYATATAAQELESRAERRYLIVAAEGAVELAQLRREFVDERLAELERSVALGVADEREVAAGQFEAAQVTLDLARAQLDLEEIELSGRSPRSDLTAPSVSGRDFVSERLQIEVRYLDRALAVMGRERERPAVTTDQEEETRWLRYEMEQLRARRRDLGQQLENRRQFLAGEIDGERIIARRELDSAREQLRDAERQLEMMRQGMEETRDRAAIGVADENDLRVMQFQLRSVEIQARLARLQLQIARERAGE